MAELYFDVKANYEEVIRLREECKRLEEQITATAKATGNLDATAELQKNLTEATEKLNGLVDEAAKAGAELENNAVAGFKSASGSASQLATVLGGVKDGLSSYISEQVKAGNMDADSADKARKLVSTLEALQSVLNVVKMAQAANNVQTAAGSAATTGLAAAETGATTATVGLTASVNALNVAMKANPIGLALSLIPLAITAVSNLTSSTAGASSEVKEFNKAVTKEIENLDDLYDVLESTNSTTKTHREALDEVNEMCKKYNTTLLNENDTLEQQKKKYDELTLAIRAANAEKIGGKYIDKAQEAADKSNEKALKRLRETFGNMSESTDFQRGYASFGNIREDVWAQLGLQTQMSAAGLAELSGAAYEARLKTVVKEFKDSLVRNSDVTGKEIESMDTFITDYVKSLATNAQVLNKTTEDIKASVGSFSTEKRFMIENLDEATFEQLEAEWERLSDEAKREEDSFEKIGNEAKKRAVESRLIEKAISGTRGELKERKRRLEKEIDDLPETSEQIKQYQDAIDAIDAELKNRKNPNDGGDDDAKDNGKSAQKEKQYRDKMLQTAQKYSELDRKQQEKASRQWIDSFYESEQGRIDAMEKGTEKAIAQMDLDHKKELEALRRVYADLRDEKIKRAKELYEANPENYDGQGKLKSPFIYDYTDTAYDPTDQETQRYNAQVDATNERHQRERSKVLLDQYKDYNTQRIELEKKYDTDVRLLEDARDQASEEERGRYDNAIIQATKEKNDALLSLDQEYSDKVKKSFGDVSKMTVEEVMESIETLEALLNDGQERSVESIEAIQNALKNLRSVTEDFTLDGLMKRSKAISEGGRGGMVAQIKNIKDAWANMTKEQKWSAVTGWVGGIADGLGQAAQYMAQIAESTEDEGLKESAEQMGAVAQNFSAAAKGAATGGWIGAIVGGVTDIVSQTINAFTQAAAETAEMKRNAEDFAKALQLASYSVDSSKFESIFGTDKMSLAREYALKATDAINGYTDELNALNKMYNDNLAKILGFGDADKGAKKLRELGVELQGLQEMRVKTLDRSGWANFWGSSDKYTRLGDLAPQIFEGEEINLEALELFLETNTQISDEQREQLQNLLDIKKAYDDNQKALEDYLSGFFGNMSSDLAQATIDGMRSGSEIGAQYMRDNMMNAVTNLEQQLVSGVYNSYLSQYQKKFMDAITNGGSEDDILAIYGELFSGMDATIEKATMAATRFEEEAEKYGFDMDKLRSDYEEQATKGSFQGMSQQMGAALEGRFTAVQISNEAIREQATMANAKLDSMMANAMSQVRIAEEVLQGQAEALIELRAINSNTRPLAFIREEISLIRSKVERL